MSNMTRRRLPLRIPSGWFVSHNELREVDPDRLAKGDPDWTLFSQDLMQLRQPSTDLLVDVGWHPDDDPSGAFVLVVITGENWERPLLRLTTRKLSELVERLEAILLMPPTAPETASTGGE
jgi:hypothetical protein